MKSLHLHLYQSAVRKFNKFKSRLDRNVSTGRFQRFTRKKQHELLQRLERIRRQILQLRLQFKLAGTGALLAMVLQASPAEAQTAVGPFVEAPENNPLRPPLPFINQRPVPVFADLDGDGDKDLIVGSNDSFTAGGKMRYFENVGTTKPIFAEVGFFDARYPFGTVFSNVPVNKYAYVPAFADIDADGDQDLLLGTDESGAYNYGHTFYFENQGDATTPDFQPITGNANPFDGISSWHNAHPSFADMDSDGDLDLLLGGYYGTATYNNLLQYFENTGTVSSPVMVNTNSQIPRPTLIDSYVVNDLTNARSAPLQVADLDEDGDLDFFYVSYDVSGALGQVVYLRNDGGVFEGVATDATQTGAWVPDATTPSNSQGNPFDFINQDLPTAVRQYTSFALVDLDNDGDQDVVMAYQFNSYYDLTRTFVYYENLGQGVFEIKEGLASPVDGVLLGTTANSSVADVDVDGDPDIIATGLVDNNPSNCDCYSAAYGVAELYQNDGSGLFTKQELGLLGDITLRKGATVQFIDVDQDGDLDVVSPYYDDYDPITATPGTYNGLVKYYKNEGGTLVEQSSIDNPFGFISSPYNNVYVDLGDLDSDGDLDAVVSINGSDLTVYENIGGNAFPEFQRKTEWETDLRSSDTGYFMTHPKFLDLDHDGDLDMISGKYHVIWYFENIGDATAPIFKQYSDGDYYDADGILVLGINNPFNNFYSESPGKTNVIDGDGDGDMDLLLGKEDGTFSYYQNDNPTPTVTAANNVAIVPDQPAILDPDLTLDDADNDYIVRAVVTLPDIDAQTELLTVGTLPAGIVSTFEVVETSTSGVFDGVLTLSGRATKVDYQTALQSVVYTYLSTPSAGRTSGGGSGSGARTINKNISMVVLDSDHTRSSSNTIAINITHVNNAPALSSGVSSIQYNSGTMSIDGAMNLSDPDDSRYSNGTITVSFTGGSYVSGQDILDATVVTGVTKSFNSANGTLTLSGTATLAEFQTVLRSVTYRNSSGSPNKQIRNLRFVVNDGTSNSNAVSISMTFPNSAPQLSSGTTAASFTGAPVVIDNAIVVADVDNSIASATIQITTGLVATEDVLLFVDQNGITGSYDAATGVLTLTGVSTVANYATALKSITYSNVGTNRTSGARIVVFTINDGSASSNSTQVSVGVSNASPVLNTSTTTIQYGGTALSIDPALNIADADNTNLTGATVALSAGYESGEDALQFTTQNGITGSFNAGTGILTLAGTSTLANYQAALRSVTYQNLAANRTNTARTVSIQVSDGANNSNLINISLQVPNVAPAVSGVAGSSFTGSDLLISSALQISDSDDISLTGATIHISSGYSEGEDVLVFTNQLGITGTFNVPAAQLTLTGNASLANYEAALRTVLYRNVATDRTNQDRTISIDVSDGTDSSLPVAIILSVPNVAPALTLVASTLTYSSGNLVLDAQLTTSDADDTNFSGATVSITNGFASGQDELVFANQNGITGSFDVTLGVLTLSGVSSVANYTAALRSVSFRNTSTNPAAGSRTIAFKVSDGLIESAPMELTLGLSNTAPTLASTNSSIFYGAGKLVIDATLVPGDVDNSNLAGATIQITSGLTAGEDQLVFIDQNGITGIYTAATGTLVLTGSSSIGNYQDALRSVQYENLSSAPSLPDRQVTFSVTDGSNASNVVSTTITINRPPVVNVNPQAIGVGGEVNFTIDNILSDPDNNLDLTTLDIVSEAGAEVVISGGQVTIDYGNLPNFKGTDVLTITVCDLAGRCQTQTVNISLESSIIVYNGVSPNSDTANDYFKIRFLPPGSTVSIFNRWGDKVYEKKDYKSDVPGQRFEGFNDNGNELASGTYFYKIETPDGKTTSGYLTLKR